MPLRYFLKSLQFQPAPTNSHEYLFDIINLFSEGIIVSDPKGVVIFCNKKAPKILHRSEQSILNHEVTDIFKKAFIPKTKFFALDARSTLQLQAFGTFFEKQVLGNKKSLIEQDILYQNRSQENILSLNVRPVFDDNDLLEVIIISFREVTKRREYQENQIRFARIMGHELKHPLASVKAYIHFLRKLSDPQNARIHSYLDKTDQQINMLVKMINDLLDISKISANRLTVDLQVKDVTKLVEETVNDLRPVHRTHMIVFDGQPSLHSEIDELRFRQVMTNLISNAVKYSPVGATIKVQVHKVAHQVVIEVIDQGSGIEEVKIKRIFDPYIRVISKTTQHVKGLGLGLYIAKNIIDKHKGNIYARNNEQKGTNFTIELPLVKA